MTALTVILIVAGIMLAVGLLTVLAWFIYTSYLNRVEKRLAERKGLYRDLVAGLAMRDRALLDQTIHQMSTLYDLDALEAVLEEQARTASGRPGWLLEVYDRLGLVDKYIEKLRSARKWRDRAFAAELLGRVGGAKAVPVLLETVQATRTEDSDVREIALRALARIGDPHAVDPLIHALTTSEAWLAPRIADILTRHGELVVDPLIAVLSDSSPQAGRAWAANVLGEVGAQRAFPVLIRGLADPDDEVRAKSATALGRLGDRRALSYLLEHLLSDPAPFVRVRIACTLGQFGGPEVVDRLVRALGDPAWWVRMRSVEALEQIGAVAEGPLLVALDDPDPEIRIRAAVSLERLGVPGNLVRMIESGDRPPEAAATLVKFASAGARELLAELALHPSSQVRQAVLTAIGRAERRDLAGDLIGLASRDTEASLRAGALETLRALGIPDALPAALTALSDPDGRVRASALRLIGELGDADAVAALRSQASDPEATVRVAAARALGAIRAPVAEPDFIRLLGDPKPAVREAAILGAADAGLHSLLPSMVELLADSEASVRREAARAIGVLGDRSVVPILIRAFPNAPPGVRQAIAAAVSRLDRHAVGGLVDALMDSDDIESKLALIRTLRRAPEPESAHALERLSDDPEPAVRAAAIEALGYGARFDASADHRVTRLVAGALHDPDEAVRIAAVDAFARIKSDEAGRMLLTLLQEDPSATVRERAALAVGLCSVPGGEEAVIAACRRAEPAEVRAAAALAAGAFGRENVVQRVADMPDQVTVRELLRERIKRDPRFRLLARRLSAIGKVELRALSAPSTEEVQLSLAEGMRAMLDPGDRVRVINSLRAYQGDQSRGALLQVIRGDPTPEVRTAALEAVAEVLPPEELMEVGSRALGDPSLLVRRAAVALFQKVTPDRGLAKLLKALRVADDPAVLAAAAGLAEEHFAAFHAAALALPLESESAELVVKIAHYIHHPDLHSLLPPFARSGSPGVREATADLWRLRPDLADPESLDILASDPVIAVRLIAVAAALASGRYDLLDRMTGDPDPRVRREVAIVLGGAAPLRKAGLGTLERLSGDLDPAVRAASYVARLLQGAPLPLPPGIDSQVAAQAVLDAGDLTALRDTARTDPSEDRRLAAALALALLQDEVAREVASTDPVPAIRHRVSGALELSIVNTAGASR